MHANCHKRLAAVMLSAAILAAPVAFAQSQLDFAGSVGVTNYLGEIGGKHLARRDLFYDMKLSSTRYVIGGHMRYRFDPIMGVSTSLFYGRLTGADSLSTNFGRRYRNLHFRTGIVELSTQIEVTFYKHKKYGHRYLLTGTKGRTRIDFNAYSFLGAGAFYFNPRAYYQGKWHSLQPLGTEGQGIIEGKKKYSRVQVSIPFGLGFYNTINRNLRIGVELGWRKTFTDYIDDASTTYPDASLLDPTAAALSSRTAERIAIEGNGGDPNTLDYFDLGDKRGDPKHNDNYFFGVLKVGYAMAGRRRASTPSFFNVVKLFGGKKGKGGYSGKPSRPKYRRR